MPGSRCRPLRLSGPWRQLVEGDYGLAVPRTGARARPKGPQGAQCSTADTTEHALDSLPRPSPEET